MNRAGFVLPAVLMLLLIIGVISFAMSLVATLELQAARSAAAAVAARAAAEGGLALALAEVMTTAPAVPAAVYGPWPEHGLDAAVTLELLSPAGETGAGEGGAVYRLAAAANAGRAAASVSLEFALQPRLTVLERRQ